MRRTRTRRYIQVRNILNALLIALDIYGHMAVGVFVTNTRVIGLRESRFKVFILLGHLAAWPLFGLAQAFRLGGLSRFGRLLLAPFSLGRLWALAFTLLGLRSLLQEISRKMRHAPCPSELLKSETLDLNMRDEILKVEGHQTSGARGLVNRLNQIYALEMTTHELRLGSLPKALDGFTIVQISDVHYGHYNSAEFIRRYVGIALDMKPDMVALTGDFQTYPDDVERAAQLLSPLGAWSSKERGGVGALAVLGNHDRESGEAPVTDALRQEGIKVLRNENVRIEKNGACIYVAGVADPWSYRADLDCALLGIPAGSCTILLAHVPDFLTTASKRAVDLQLSGHNHGGQITLPFFGPLLVSSRYGRRYAEGFHKVGSTLMYVSRGLGGKPPVRWGACPELARFVLRSGL
ncbi:MAG: metallophosphoesterase [Chloroflexia bacterium]